MVVLFPLSGDLGERGRLEDVKQEVEPIPRLGHPVVTGYLEQVHREQLVVSS